MRGWTKNTIAFVVTVVAMVSAYCFFVLLPEDARTREATAAAAETRN